MQAISLQCSSLKFVGSADYMNVDTWTVYEGPIFTGSEYYGEADAANLGSLTDQGSSIILTGTSPWTFYELVDLWLYLHLFLYYLSILRYITFLLYSILLFSILPICSALHYLSTWLQITHILYCIHLFYFILHASSAIYYASALLYITFLLYSILPIFSGEILRDEYLHKNCIHTFWYICFRVFVYACIRIQDFRFLGHS